MCAHAIRVTNKNMSQHTLCFVFNLSIAEGPGVLEPYQSGIKLELYIYRFNELNEFKN